MCNAMALVLRLFSVDQNNTMYRALCFCFRTWVERTVMGAIPATRDQEGRERKRERERERDSSRAENVAIATAPALRSGRERVTRVELRNSPGCIANSNHTTSNATRPPSHPDDIAGLRALYLATGGPQWYVCCLLFDTACSSALPAGTFCSCIFVLQ